MAKAQNILLLAGSSEARQIGRALAESGRKVHALMSENPKGANPMPVPFDVIPDISPENVTARLAGVDAIIDASHGFDARMTSLGAEAAREAGIPITSLSRALWDVAEHSKWQTAPDVSSAMALIDAEMRVFSATGWASLPGYEGFPGKKLMLRQTAPHDRVPPFGFVELVFGEAPFTVTTEETLFRELAVDLLICRNLGGLPSRPKLDAAKALDLPVILIDPPAKPAGLLQLRSVEEVMAWVVRL